MLAARTSELTLVNLGYNLISQRIQAHKQYILIRDECISHHCISLFQFQEVKTELRNITGDTIKIPGNLMNEFFYQPPLPPL